MILLNNMEPTQKSFFQRNLAWIVVLAVVVVAVLWGISRYNSFVTLNEQIDTQWAQVENQLKRRFDLIPNIVASVKGQTQQEKDVLLAIADARTRYAGATTVDQKASAASAVEGALARLMVIVENYPTLQSSQAFQDLRVTLEGTENRIAVERKNYNDKVNLLNVQVKRFPSSIIAGLFGVEAREYFEVPVEQQQNPTVDFSS